MSKLITKIRHRGNGLKYHMILETNLNIYTIPDKIENSTAYSTSTLLENDEWYSIDNFSQKEYKLDLFTFNLSTVDFNLLKKEDFKQIDFICSIQNNVFCIQNISKSRLIKKKLLYLNEQFKYDYDSAVITINEVPDALYYASEDKLYFRKITAITSIFKGIDQLYREATDNETKEFLDLEFITLKDDFSYDKVKNSNRRRIAMALDTLKEMKDDDKRTVFEYIKEYCPNLSIQNNTFSVENETELKSLLFGIEQRYYTTPIGGEKRIANSVIKLS